MMPYAGQSQSGPDSPARARPLVFFCAINFKRKRIGARPMIGRRRSTVLPISVVDLALLAGSFILIGHTATSLHRALLAGVLPLRYFVLQSTLQW